MSPALIALTRDYMALPGAPNMADVLFAYCRGDTFYRRDENGMLWLDVGRPDALLGEWLPDLTDRATGGVLWEISGRPDIDESNGAIRATQANTTRAVGPVDYEDRDEYARWWWYVTGSTLAEAVARVAVALGRAG